MTRIDKYIWSVRLFKTRSLATKMCKQGKVLMDGEKVKPSKEISVGDKFSIKKNNALFTYQVVEELEKRVGAKLVDDYLRDITPEEEIEKYKEFQLAQKVYRQQGTGKPSKKDRRKIKKFMDR